MCKVFPFAKQHDACDEKNKQSYYFLHTSFLTMLTLLESQIITTTGNHGCQLYGERFD